MQEGEKAIEVHVILDKTAPISPVLNVSLMIDRTNMTEDVFVFLTSILAFTIRYNCMHPKLRVLAFFNQMRSHCRGYHVGHKGASLGKVSGEVHFFPTILLLEQFHARESKVLTNTPSLDKVYHAVWIGRNVLTGSEYIYLGWVLG